MAVMAAGSRPRGLLSTVSVTRLFVALVLTSGILLAYVNHLHLSTSDVHGPPPCALQLATADRVVKAATKASTKAAAAPAQPTFRGAGRQLPGADCGPQPADMLIGVLGSPSERSGKARATIRKTWLTLSTAGAVITVRFVLAVNSSGQRPDHLVQEAEEFGDMIFVDTEDAYLNLARKVQLFFRWAVANCAEVPLYMKTDDDAFVHMEHLGKKIKTVQKTKLYWGKFMKGMTGRDKHGKLLPDNYQMAHEFPFYASGAGYVLSSDVAAAVAYPRLELQHFDAEDRSIGMALYGYNITYMDDHQTFRPWGNCIPQLSVLHYQRMPELLTRRYKRAVAGKSVCGDGFKPNEKCEKARSGKNATWTCPAGKTVAKVLGATYGRVYSSGGSGSCDEGPEGLEPLEWCHAESSMAVMEQACLGKASCTVLASNKVFGIDPCKGETKQILAAVRCE